MKKIVLAFGVIGLFFASCDKVENPNPEVEATELDYSLSPEGDSVGYWTNHGPNFTANTNTLRNVLIEDFTGHKCTFCPLAADTAEQLHQEYPSRVFVAAIHTGPSGIGGFQSTSSSFPTDWTNTDGLDIGIHFGSIPGSQFDSNPRGTVSRIKDGDQHTITHLLWRQFAESAMTDQLQANAQAKVNYFPATRGVFLHSEVEILDQTVNADDLYTVVYLIEDSIIGKQKMPDNSTNDFYVHREVMRDCVGSGWQGRQLTDANKQGDKYYFNYSFRLDDVYDASNMHLLIYVRNAVTEEIYQVVKAKIE